MRNNAALFALTLALGCSPSEGPGCKASAQQEEDLPVLRYTEPPDGLFYAGAAGSFDIANECLTIRIEDTSYIPVFMPDTRVVALSGELSIDGQRVLLGETVQIFGGPLSGHHNIDQISGSVPIKCRVSLELFQVRLR